MIKKIKVFAPATVANLGCGFDVMGMALEEVGDILEVSVSEGFGLQIYNESKVPLPENVEKNVITPAVLAFMDAWGRKMKVEIRVLQKIRPGSGIGSSAASSSAAVYALNELLDCPFTTRQLIPFAMEGERLISGAAHADNVGPALLGGIVLVRSYEPLDVISLPVPETFCCSVVHPHIVVSTKEAREVLRKEIPLRDAVIQWGNVGGLVAGLALGDTGLVGRSMQDVIAEPYRKHFIPLYDELKKGLMSSGALAVNISGSGPSVFALSGSWQQAIRIGELMQQHFNGLDITADIYISRVGRKGTRVLDIE